MQRPALDFGDSGVVRFNCDACSKPLLVCYRGLAGDYCSQACRDRSDAERAKAKISQAPEVKLAPAEKVKLPLSEKVKTAPLPKVKMGELPKAKIAPPEEVKIRQTSPPDPKVKLLGRAQRQIERRAAIRSIRREILKATGREPTIAEVQSRLSPIGLAASVRTVWKDIRYTQG